MLTLVKKFKEYREVEKIKKSDILKKKYAKPQLKQICVQIIVITALGIQKKDTDE